MPCKNNNCGCDSCAKSNQTFSPKSITMDSENQTEEQTKEELKQQFRRQNRNEETLTPNPDIPAKLTVAALLVAGASKFIS